MDNISIEFLLPCPFCGGKASLSKYDYDMGHEHIPGIMICCATCKIKLTDEAFGQTLEKAKENVIKKWNNRV